ncbi:hypothetical protein FQR65_LT06673 [Abscondita terminalis]|nr:hypothetical protein FQR65_LT06673 [Abscondita terminalis]
MRKTNIFRLVTLDDPDEQVLKTENVPVLFRRYGRVVGWKVRKIKRLRQAGTRFRTAKSEQTLMEKRRRARINQSLAALKTLILDSAKAENTKHSKLEKADILELTVRHFQRHRSLDTQGVQQYRAGYADCVREVQRYLETPDAQTMAVMDPGVRQRLLQHLDSCVSEVDVDLQQNNERLQPDSSSEEANDNNNNSNDQKKQEAVQNFPNKVVKMNDGSYVFVLPSHYLQIAAALGINLRSYQDSILEQKQTEEKKQNTTCEKPLDFSKNNEMRDNMWRPW